jgi:hypothetical protein
MSINGYKRYCACIEKNFLKKSHAKYGVGRQNTTTGIWYQLLSRIQSVPSVRTRIVRRHIWGRQTKHHYGFSAAAAIARPHAKNAGIAEKGISIRPFGSFGSCLCSNLMSHSASNVTNELRE